MLVLLGLVAGVWLVTAAMTWFDVRHELDELLDSHLAQAAALLVVQQMRDVEEGEPGLDTPTLHRYSPKVAFQVFHEGRLAMRSANAPTLPMASFNGMSAVGAGTFMTAQIDGVTWRVFATQGAERDVRVYVGEQVASRATILLAALRSTLWPMFLALPLLAAATGLAVHRGLAPLRVLGRALDRRPPQALDAVRVPDAPSEMVPMLGALNGLLARIAELLDAERRFTADAAHELRTPIAAIRAQAQVALAETDVGLRHHALVATLAGCDRATRLVEQLLTLSRLEAGTQAYDTKVDLKAVAQQVVAWVAPQAIHKKQNIELVADGGCTVVGDAMLLSVLVRNLVDNAVRYSPAQAHIRVGVKTESDRVCLTVEDGGPGIAETDLPRLGERFFRVLGSGQEGSGLGWSIVRRVAAAHGASTRIGKSATFGGLRVEVVWAQSVNVQSAT